MRHYAQQARYAETLLLRAVDAIQSKSKQPPVILLQADEGFDGNEADLGEAAVRDIRVKGISAAYLPGMPEARLPDRLNTVNTSGTSSTSTSTPATRCSGTRAIPRATCPISSRR
jgi:hypothetical protein